MGGGGDCAAARVLFSFTGVSWSNMTKKWEA